MERNRLGEDTFLFFEPGDELFGGYRSDLLLLGGDVVKQIGQTRQQRLLAPLVLHLVLENAFAKRLAEVQRLQHGIRIASVAKLRAKGETRC